MIKEILKMGYDSFIEESQQQTSVVPAQANHGQLFGDEGWSFNTALGGVSSQAGEVMSPIKALGVPAQFACVKVISEDVGKLPLIPYRSLEGAAKERLTTGVIKHVLKKQAAPNLTPMTFKQTVTQWAVNWGNGYAEIVRNSRGEPVELWPIHPSRVKVSRDSNGAVWYIVRFVTGDSIKIPAKDIIHIRGLGDELVGWNLPVSVAKETMGTAFAQIIFAASFFGNSVTPSAVLMHQKHLSDKAQRRLRAGMSKVFGGARNAAKLLVLEEDMKYQPISMPLKQAQFLESREFSVEEVARYHRMPLHKIQSMKQATNNNIEQQALEYKSDTLDPWLIRWEQEINLKFWPNTDNFFVEFLVEALLRGDFKSRTEGYVRMWSIGVMNHNEIRAKENLNPIPGGNTHFVPLNMIPLGDAEAMAEQNAIAGRDNNRQSNSDGDDAKKREEARRDNVIGAFNRIIGASTERLVKMEMKALQRAHGKNNIQEVMVDFYRTHCIRMVETLLPQTKSYFQMLGVQAIDLEGDLTASCQTFCEEAKSEISMAVSLQAGGIRSVLDKWGKERAANITGAIVGIGLACWEKSAKIDNNN